MILLVYIEKAFEKFQRYGKTILNNHYFTPDTKIKL